jgi:hypothetical protein
MYAAPEIVSSNGFPSKHRGRTDVFALVAIFYEMLAVINGHSVYEFHGFLLVGQEARAGGILL